MKRKTIIGIGLTITVAVIVVIGMIKINRSQHIDRCLDCGGRWNYETNKCEGVYEINSGNLTKFYWFTDYDSISNREFLVKGTFLDSIGKSPNQLIEILNKRNSEPKIEFIDLTNDTIIIKITNDEFLSERMGSTGAECFLAETVFTLTENKTIKFVNIEMDYDSHGIPGTYQRVNYKELEKDSYSSIIGAWGEDDIGNAEFAFYKDSLYYPDPNIWCRYKIVNDTILLQGNDGWIEKILILKVTKDSLRLNFLNYDEIDSYARR